MPEFDLRYVKAATYNNAAGVITYTGPVLVGDAMEANLELKFAEGRLYAEGSLAEYMKKCTGGTVSLGVKYIKEAAKLLLFGFAASSTSVKVGAETKSVAGMSFGKNSQGSYVGVAFFAPDKVDGADKFTCVFIARAMFGPPAMKFKTMDGSTITFQTPTITGEFLADHSAEGLFLDTASVDTMAEAQAWVDAKLPSA